MLSIMGGIFTAIVALVLVWLGLKVVKFVFKLILWAVALSLMFGFLYFYYGNPSSATKEKSPTTTSRPVRNK
jgi:uncharacterized membrane protein YkgB